MTQRAQRTWIQWRRNKQVKKIRTTRTIVGSVFYHVKRVLALDIAGNSLNNCALGPTTIGNSTYAISQDLWRVSRHNLIL